MDLTQQVNEWIGQIREEDVTDEGYKRRKILIDEVPISFHTLRQLRAGRYVPGELMANGLRAVMERIGPRSLSVAKGKAATG